ncbi:helix-turn-helix transcriptional regulator [Dielma fastidiosa]|uniref:Helix-turn-helix transcriptional regulator n=1 Tax=Dielma fastidiosa TaxID=1034346 RepID=A0AB35UUW9_9FIRM|nr:helix-turn-helix transcriptional regulator [Dielma fastidiosa]MDY5169059.1 helix-turn-helix transcriptional regulator [Dielma fastidiosa]
MNNLGNKIRIWRNYRKLTLEEVDHLTGIHYARLSKFERGVEIPNQQMLARIEKALNVSFDDLEEIDDEIELLINKFIDTLFYLNEDYDDYLRIIEKRKEDFILNQNYYKVQLIEYIIYVIQENAVEANKIESILDKIVEKRTLYEQLYLEYKAINIYNLRKFQSAIDILESAMAISSYNKSSAMIYYHLSILYHGCARYEESEKYIQKAKQLFVEGCSYKRVLNCDIQLANYYIRVGRYDLAIDLLKSCIETMRYLNVNTHTKALALRNTAWTYILLNEFDNSLKILEAAEQLEPENGNLILYKIWCNYKLEKYNTAKEIISDNYELSKDRNYGDRFQLFDYLVNQGKQRPAKRTITQAKKVYFKLADEQRFGNLFFYLDILIDLLERDGDKDELIHFLKIKGHLGK